MKSISRGASRQMKGLAMHRREGMESLPNV